MNDKIALFDMDDTIVDFQGTLRRRLLKTMGPNETFPTDIWNMPDYWYERAQAIKKEPGFWHNLPQLQWGTDVMNMAREIGFDIHILTKGPAAGSLAWKEKVDWVHDHLNDVTLHITEDKSIAYGRVFVDDYFPFMKLWLEHRPRGLGVVNYSSNHSQLVSVMDGMNAVRTRLQEAYDRSNTTRE